MVSRRTVSIISLVVLSVTFGGFTLDLSGDGLHIAEDVLYGTDPLSSDTNGDGLSDYEEIQRYGTDPLNSDTNGDGLSDYDEIHRYGTIPLIADTDRDGLSDYDEVHEHGTDPTTDDTTGDGISDYAEIHRYGTDPTTPDTNGDGLSDYSEIFTHGTDPLKLDTNEDGLSDYDEVQVYRTDPLKLDTNSDGLSDYDEVHVYGTDPTVADTTGDGLSDYDEIHVHGTDPTIVDTNGDGLSDYDEIHLYRTDPLELDTNGDGLSDYEEIHIYRTNPLVSDTYRTGVSDYDSVTTYGLYGNPSIGDTEQLSRLFEKDNHVYSENPLAGSTSSNYGRDTSGDGFSDRFSRSNEHLTPDEIDIFIQVSYMEGVDAPVAPLLAVQQAYENAPVTNSEGEEVGINLHLYIDDEPVGATETIGIEEYAETYYEDNFTARGYGFYHVLIAQEVADMDGNAVGGYAWEPVDGVLVEDSYSDRYVGYVFMHEIGHMLGLYPREYHGIDSEQPIEEYPSVMNYKTGDECSLDIEWCYRYSDSEGFDDWSQIESYIKSHPPDTSKLEE